MIRLDIEGMKYQVVHALSQNNKEIEKAVSAQLETAIQNFDFEAVITVEIQHVLPGMIKRAVQDSLQKVMMSEKVRNQFDSMVASSLSKQLSELNL